jgi:nitroreductase
LRLLYPRGRLWRWLAQPGHRLAEGGHGIALLRGRTECGYAHGFGSIGARVADLSPGSTTPHMDVRTAIRSRRSRRPAGGEALPRGQVEALVEAALWAPTHRLTQPWRFALLDRPAIAGLCAWWGTRPDIRDQPDPAKGAAKLAKLTARLALDGALVLVTWVRAADPAVDLEEHAAASAAVQNLLLAATAEGVASFWSTNPAFAHPATLGWLGCGSDEGFLAAVSLGHPGDDPPTPPRAPLATRARWVAPR